MRNIIAALTMMLRRTAPVHPLSPQNERVAAPADLTRGH
jgi:hypothetical protein